MRQLASLPSAQQHPARGLADAQPALDVAENLLITAHNADYTDDYFELGWQVWASNFERFSAGEPLDTPVDMNSGY